ncbi:hypothetical protein [Kribbella sp. NBC_00889]|nr:hypothetical protein OG817_08185 [Kribbella sp. NBC_00889]
MVDDRWRDAVKAAGKGADVEAVRDVDPDLVERFLPWARAKESC